MASLIELDTIETDAQSTFSAGELPEVTQARALRRRIRMAALRVAEAIIDDPSDPDGKRDFEKIAWARETIHNLDAMALSLMRLALVDAAPNATPAQILGVTDAAIQTVITKLVPRLANGLRVDLR